MMTRATVMELLGMVVGILHEWEVGEVLSLPRRMVAVELRGVGLPRSTPCLLGSRLFEWPQDERSEREGEAPPQIPRGVAE